MELLEKQHELIPNVDVPEGERGRFKIEHFTVSEKEAQFERMRAIFQAHRGQMGVPAGTYTCLKENGSILMSDTPDEKRDHAAFVQRAHGRVLITGLGLGMVLQACLLKDEVESVTVIEISRDLIELVNPHYASAFFYRNFKIIEADAFTWKPPKGEHWNMAWHDIWPAICGDNVPEMTKLKRRYGRYCDEQFCWREHSCRRPWR